MEVPILCKCAGYSAVKVLHVCFMIPLMLALPWLWCSGISSLLTDFCQCRSFELSDCNSYSITIQSPNRPYYGRLPCNGVKGIFLILRCGIPHWVGSGVIHLPCTMPSSPICTNMHCAVAFTAWKSYKLISFLTLTIWNLQQFSSPLQSANLPLH